MPVELQLFVKRVARDDKLIEQFEAEVIKFLSEVDQTITQLQSITERETA